MSLEESIKGIIKSVDLDKREKELSDREVDLNNKIAKKEEELNIKIAKKEEELNNKISKFKQLKEEHTNEVRRELLESQNLSTKEIYELGDTLLKDLHFVTLEDTDEMWIYDTSFYVPLGEVTLKKFCSKSPRSISSFVYNTLKNKVSWESYTGRANFQQPRELMNLKNGILDINSGKLLEHTHKYYFQGVLNASFEESATCPIWEKSTRNLFENEEDYIEYQKWIGSHFSKQNDQKMLILHGPPLSGKSQSLSVLIELLGKKNVVSFEPQDFAYSEYARGKLFGKVACINPDMSTRPIKDITTLKKIISWDLIQGRNIYEAPFEFFNYAKLTSACNIFPYIKNSIIRSKEFQRRMILLETHIGYEKEDKNIFQKYQSELNNGGILNWIIEGNCMYREEGLKWKGDVYKIWSENMDNTYASTYGPKLPIYEPIAIEDIESGTFVFMCRKCNQTFSKHTTLDKAVDITSKPHDNCGGTLEYIKW